MTKRTQTGAWLGHCIQSPEQGGMEMVIQQICQVSKRYGPASTGPAHKEYPGGLSYGSQWYMAPRTLRHKESLLKDPVSWSSRFHRLLPKNGVF